MKIAQPRRPSTMGAGPSAMPAQVNVDTQTVGEEVRGDSVVAEGIAGLPTPTAMGNGFGAPLAGDGGGERERSASVHEGATCMVSNRGRRGKLEQGACTESKHTQQSVTMIMVR